MDIRGDIIIHASGKIEHLADVLIGDLLLQGTNKMFLVYQSCQWVKNN
jgi:hypothetical protein